ncbi:choice-of-anchor tandem repeat GloVer-containing protein [Candidatus Auribacterota bacterium]
MSEFNTGTVFKLDTDGANFALLHSFAGGGDDGSSPRGELTFSGSDLYGMTRLGGDSDYGVIFSMDTEGGGFSLLHEFAGNPNDGESPYGSLAISNGKAYGMTYTGGESDLGVVFSYGPVSGGGQVPEPSTILMFLLLAAGFGLRYVRKKK